MQVTLKKAAELSRATLAASKAIEPKSVIGLSVFSVADVSEVVAKARVDFDEALLRSTNLVDTSFVIRDLIGGANSAAGVDKMLTKVAAIDEMVARIAAATSAEKVGYESSATDTDDMTALARRVEQARKDSADSESRRFGGGREDVRINVIGEAQKALLADQLSVLKRRRAAIKDELTAINFSTKITLPDTVVEVLRAERLID